MSATTASPMVASVIEGDAIDAITTFAECSVDAVITDPPYGIGFHRERWDSPTGTLGSFEDWTRAWAIESLRVLKPGGHLVAFGAPRTAHRLASAIEDAGFELRDQLLWMYGTGVPKARLHRGRASQLKPAYEPILLARKPLEGTLSANEQTWGTGRLGIDNSRIPSASDPKAERWPANITLTHSPGCAERCAPGCAVRRLEDQRPGASRFFYCAKPSRSERDRGCQHLPARPMTIYGPSTPPPRHNTHPTVKPVALMRWLIRLACPHHGLVLDPFAGSGTTGIAAINENRSFVGIEQNKGYARIARARLRHAKQSRAG